MDFYIIRQPNPIPRQFFLRFHENHEKLLQCFRCCLDWFHWSSFFFFTFTVVENLPWLLYYLIVHLIESNTADLSKSINSRWRQETKLYFSICSIGVSIELITTFEWYYCCVDFQSSNSFNLQNCWTDFSLRHSFILISEQQIRTSSAATPKKEKKNAMLTSPEFVSFFFL